VDEAHSCARPVGQSGPQQQRHQLIADLAEDKAKNIILVTATPHSGFDQSFQSLLGFIKPEFESFDLDKIEKFHRAELAMHFVQRRRKDVEQWMDTETRFPERIPLETSFQLSPAYKSFFEDVYRFAREVVISDEQEKTYRRRVRFWAALALLRCVMSSPAAAKAALLTRLGKISEEYDSETDVHTADIYDPTEIESTVDIVPSHVVDAGNERLTETERRKLQALAKRVEGLKD
ncbi:MAG: helicase, partial [bacterium]